MTREEVLLAIKEIKCRYCLPALEINYTDKDYACREYERLIFHLIEQLEKKDNRLKEASRQLRSIHFVGFRGGKTILSEYLNKAINILENEQLETATNSSTKDKTVEIIDKINGEEL